jgi:cystathionine beta-lyase/cystathionine gamma-synthase
MVVLSITKGYTAGMLGGAVVTDSDELGEKIFKNRQARGGNASPNDSAEHSKQIESMYARMEKLSENAQAVVQFLKHDSPTQGIDVLYPENIGIDRADNTSAYLMRPPGVFTLQCRLPVGSYAALVRHFDEKLIRSNSFNGSVAQFSESTKQSHASVKDGGHKANAGIVEQLIRVSPSSTFGAQTIVRKFAEMFERWRSDIGTTS